MQLIEVAFKGNRKEFFRWEQDEPLAVRTPVIVEADRGEDLGLVHAVGELALKRSRGTPHGVGDAVPTRAVRRVATPEEAASERLLRLEDEDARRRAVERVKANGLVMKLTDAEWQWDRRKLTLFFTAEKRVDFRNLVRELAAMFRTRIELKQIGVRDEARRLDGIGRCGRQYCSAAWLPELRPVNLGVAKDQKLSLNPSQISGACGRLMCSLRYEHAFYVQARKRFPKEGRIIRSALGEEKVLANDIFRERVALRNVEGEVRTVPLAALRAEMEAAAAELGLAPPSFGSPAEPGVEAGDADAAVDEALVAAPERPASGRSQREDRPAREARPPRPARRPAPDSPSSPAASVHVTVESAGDTRDVDVPPVTVSSDAPGPDAAEADADQRRPARRRGRRGGRRNRPPGTRDGTPPDQPGGSPGEHA